LFHEEKTLKTNSKPRMGRPPVLENARNRILDEAAALFGEGGYDKSSLNDVAERLGVTKAAVYHYFGTKQAIYEGITLRTLEGLAERVNAAVAGAEGAQEKLRAFMTTHAAYFEKNYWGFVCMLVGYGGMTNPSMISEINQIRVDYENVLRKIIKDGVVEGCFVDVDVTIASHSVLSMLNWMVRWFKPNGPRRAEYFAGEYYKVITKGILNSENQPAL